MEVGAGKNPYKFNVLVVGGFTALVVGAFLAYAVGFVGPFSFCAIVFLTYFIFLESLVNFVNRKPSPSRYMESHSACKI